MRGYTKAAISSGIGGGLDARVAAEALNPKKKARPIVVCGTATQPALSRPPVNSASPD
jgi:hypothetical protein